MECRCAVRFSRLVFGFERTRSENKDLHIHAKILLVPEDSAEGDDVDLCGVRTETRIVCNGIFTPFRPSFPTAPLASHFAGKVLTYRRVSRISIVERGCRNVGERTNI